MSTPVPTALPSEIASLGTYFAFHTDDRPGSVEPPWRPLGDLLDGSGLLAARYEQFRASLERTSGTAVEFRVAASTGHLALMARLICVAFGAALLGRSVDLSRARWQPVIGGVMPLSLPTSAIGPAADISGLLTGPVRTLTELTVNMSVSSKVLWGNVHSAVNGAVMTAGATRPDLATRAISLGRALGTDPGPEFRRRSCCLIYRIGPAGSAPPCGDCVLQG